MGGVRGWVQEHRLRVARKLDRALLRTEVVHHINGIRDDNAIENLVLISNSGHGRQHANIMRELGRLRNENAELRRQLAALPLFEEKP